MKENQKSPAKTFSDILSDKRINLIKEALGKDAELYLVGGYVRDLIISQTNKNNSFASADLDIACSLPANETLNRLNKKNIKTVAVALKHSTLLAVPIENEPGIEITSLRKLSQEGKIVEGNSIEEDLSLRDFTINSIALCLNSLELIDPLSGAQDIKNSLIKANKARARFREDPARILRLARFISVLNFKAEKNTTVAAQELAEKLKLISKERIQGELNKILLSSKPSVGIRFLHKINALSLILPEVARQDGLVQNIFHKDLLLDHTLEVVDKSKNALKNRLAALLHDISKPETLSIDDSKNFRHFYLHEKVGAKKSREILKELKYSGEVIKEVETVVRCHMRPISAGDAGLRRLIRDLENTFDIWRDIKEADATSCAKNPSEVLKELEEFDQRITEIKKEKPVHKLAHLEISGEDLLKIGFKQGRYLGKVLEKLHEEIIEDPSKNHKEKLIKIAKEILQTKKLT